ncbi:MAG: ATP-dependent helicase [Candidatus Moranbacteria bacterium]|nr:ATP-dependent helicase [Candidatus Moranbacteria bacterium]
MDIYDQILKSQAKRICVIAAPGSGKTKRGLIPKVAQILEDSSIDPKNILLLTFSRLSAKDLKSRVSDFERKPRASTVHSICLAFLLSENNHDMRKRVESIVLDFEKNALISDLKITFPSINKKVLERMLKAFSVGWATSPHAEVFEEDNVKRAFKAAVINWLSEHEAAMMEEIVYEAVELAKSLGATDFITTPQFIFVDEYQDLNRLEQEFIELLAEKSKLLFLVGDPDQSIYSFKYAYPDGIKAYSKRSDVEPYFSNKTGRCPRKVVEIANQILKQMDPARTVFLEPLREDEGEVNFIVRNTQTEEFEYILRSVAERLRSGAKPQDIFILTPRNPLGINFVDYANTNKEKFGIEDTFKFDSKLKLTTTEQERILLFGLAVNQNSLLHIRGYLALGDSNAEAGAVKTLKSKYGNLKNAFEKADSEDFSKVQRRARALCERIVELRGLIKEVADGKSLDDFLDQLLPREDENTKALRLVVDELREDEDTTASLYTKITDYIRTVPTATTDIRVMTLMGSKGLDAKHVYIIGCNGGNLPGENRSVYLTDHEHKQEQRRLLFVGITRAIESLTISWTRNITYGQSMQHHTTGLRTTRRVGQPPQMVVPISEFLQGLTGIVWM